MNIRGQNADWVMLTSVAFIAAMSMLTLASLSMDFFWRQLMWWGAALLVFILGFVIDWKWLSSQRWFSRGVYAVALILLVFSYIQPGTVRGTKAWITIGGFQFEPVELMKLGLILVLAAFFSKRHVAAWQGRNIATSFFLVAVPGLLVAAHPDLGSAVVVFSIWGGFLLMSGIHVKRFLMGLLAALLGAVLVWTFVLKDYQKDRITAFIFPERDPLGINYNVIQSKIAIGSAGFLGKGFKGGTQTHLNFLPEAETDFIFASFVEEWGIVGGALLILAYFLILWRFTAIGARARDNYSKFIALGGIIVFSVHLLINTGSNLGLVPVTGITLPFMSYGGSSLLTTALLVSIIHSTKLESSV
jgi:rod shape determining protein RodA